MRIGTGLLALAACALVWGQKSTPEIKLLARGFQFPEGPALDRDGKEAFYRFEGRSYGIDGMKFDQHGNLWVAMYSESELWCISPEGRKIDSVAIPGKNPTNLIFGGPGRRTAYVTVHHDRDGRLFAVQMPVPGAP